MALHTKKTGETKVVAVFGTSGNQNNIAQEQALRGIFQTKKDWKLIAVRSGASFTPELIQDADLLIVCRDNAPDLIDLSSPDAGVANTMRESSTFWTRTTIDSITENVSQRGMGLILLNSAIACGSHEFNTFAGAKSIDGNAHEPLWARRLNQDHPITGGIGKFLIPFDSQYGVIVTDSTADTLFETTAVHEKRQTISGWALKRNNGRIVGLLPGGTAEAYRPPEYRNIIWRAAHWAMKITIENYPEARNTLYD